MPLLGTLAAGQEKGELATTSLEFFSNSPVAPRPLSCQISANQREAGTSVNVNKLKTGAKGTNVISAKQHFDADIQTPET